MVFFYFNDIIIFKFEHFLDLKNIFQQPVWHVVDVS